MLQTIWSFIVNLFTILKNVVSLLPMGGWAILIVIVIAIIYLIIGR